MTTIPREVLSDHFQERMQGRRIVSALFTTFRFEPAFFETQILPAFFDSALSQADAIRLVQLEVSLRELKGSIAVYYDRNGLVADGGSSKLDVRRIAVSHSTGIFHPKNVFALVEAVEPDEAGHHARTLLCACLSANLTRAGWWENVEVAHVEEIAEAGHTNLRDALIEYLDRLVRTVVGQRLNDELRKQHAAASDIREFLRGTTQREHRSVTGRLRTHFHDGDASLPDFIRSVAGNALQGMCLEIVTPYFDSGAESAPLSALLREFEPREVRVLLPKNDRGEAECPESLHAWVASLPNAKWGSLPEDLLRRGKAEEAKRRRVHAKVYRFFEPVRAGREVLYIGSTNLTQAGCRIAGRGGNWETGFLVEVTSPQRPTWWMSANADRPRAFAPTTEDEGTAASGGSQLVVRYRWDAHEAGVLWGGKNPSPALKLLHSGVLVLDLGQVAAKEWVTLARIDADRLEEHLRSTSIFHVVGESTEPCLVLVQEEGMHARPSVLHDLSAADILRYWALLTPEQRAAFLEARARVMGDADPLLARLAPLPVESTLFDRFAGIFHAFECLEQHVRNALNEGRTREADYRLFGQKYDSLGTLLGRVTENVAQGKGDRVEHYVLLLCAQQILREVGRDHRAYWSERRAEVKQLEAQLESAGPLRSTLAASNHEMPAFLDWFDAWFLERAEALEPETSA